MEKKHFLFLVLIAVPVVTAAQLKVKSDGHVVAGTELQTNSSYIIGLQSGI